MQSRGGLNGNEWPKRQQPLGRRFPVAGTFSDDHPLPFNHQTSNLTQAYPATYTDTQYLAPQQIFQEPTVPFSGIPFEQPNFSFPTNGYQLGYDRDYDTGDPVVHEGFIPAPGNENEGELEDQDIYPDPLAGYLNPDLQSSEDDDSEDERWLQAEEERILREAQEKTDDLEFDADYSTDDGDFEDEEDEIIHEDEVEDEYQPRRGRPSARGSRGGRRGRPSTRGRGGMRGAASTRGKKTGRPGRPKGHRGPRPTADPGPQFKDFQRLANEAFMRKDFDLALEYGEKAIKLNPEIFNAHNVLSEIYGAMGEEQKSLEALIVGAPTKRDPGLWWHIIDRVKQMDPQKYPLFTEQAKIAITLDCLRSIITLQPENYDARSQKLELEAELGHASKCVQLARKMLTKKPTDYDVLRIMANMGTSSPKQTRIHLSRIVDSFTTSMTYFTTHDDDPSASNLDWELLNIYFDLLDRTGRYNYALSQLKTLSRWKQGRKDETYWNDQDDDREFDLEDAPRRTAVPQFSRKSPKTKYGKTLPVEIRVKMGLFRLRQDPPNFSEAMHHLDMLEPEDQSPGALFWDYEDLFRTIADTLHATEHDRVALRFYEPLFKHQSSELGLRSHLGLFTCYKNLNETEKAEELIPILRNWKTDNLDDLAVLAKFFEDHDRREEAMERGEVVFKNGGRYKLRKLGFKGYEELKDYFFQQRQQARGKHSARKIRVKKYVKKLRKATGAKKKTTADNEDSDDERGDRDLSSFDLSSFRPLLDRPGQGLFRTRKILPAIKPQTFLPIGPQPASNAKTLEGTDVPVDAIDQGLFRKKLKKLAAEYPEELKSARAQHREIVASFKRLKEISEVMENGDESAIQEFLSITRELIEEYSTFDLFYYNRKEEFKGYFRRIGSGELWRESALMALAVVANKVEDGETEPDFQEKPDKIPQEFYSIHFDEWAAVFCQYAMLLAHAKEDQRCFSTIDLAQQSNIFWKTKKYLEQLEMTRLACAIALNDSKQASAAVRWLLRTYPLGSDLLRLYSCVNRLCSFPDGYSTGPAHKVLMRYIKTMDYVLLSPEQRVWYNFQGNDQTAWVKNAISSGLVDFVKDHDPALFALYAHVLSSGGSYMAALNYYFRAFAITPDDPVLNLSIGVAYVQHAMKRQSENRQYQIQQGLAFLNRYYELRTKEGIAIHCSEAEFNVGRVWHMLGLVTHALPAYERCIVLSKRVKQEAKNQRSDDALAAEDFAMEAAFAVQTIYAVSSDFAGAKKVTEEILVLE